MGQKRTKPALARPSTMSGGSVCWSDAAGCVTGGAGPSSGLTVADPRVGRAMEARNDDHGVIGWDSARRDDGRDAPSNGRSSCRRPPHDRVPSHPHTYKWCRSGLSHTITGNTGTPGGGPFTVADPASPARHARTAASTACCRWPRRVPGTVVGHACHDNGRFSVAAPDAVPCAAVPGHHRGGWHRTGL